MTGQIGLTPLYLNGQAGIGEGDLASILNTIMFLVFMLFLFTGLNQRFQMLIWIRNIRRHLSRIERMAKQARSRSIELLKKMGADDRAVEVVDRMMEFFVIQPVADEPTALMKRLEHLLDVRNHRFQRTLSTLLPKASKHDIANASVVLEVAMVLNNIYKTVRHYLLLGERTNNWILITQLELEMPQIVRISRAYYNALEAFTTGKPVGDGIGALVAALLARDGTSKRVICEDTVVIEAERKGRRLLIVKAEGPGANVGKPGEAVKRLVEENKGMISRIIMIDAAQKLEGEETGEVIEGVGAAIGDPGPEKFKIESVAAEYGIPLDSIVIKESLEEAINVMTKKIAEAASKVIEVIDRALEERTRPGDTVIVAGIGNTVGIAQ